MIFEQLAIGGDKNFAYLVGSETSQQVAAIDPGCNPQMLFDHAKANHWAITYIIATHSHYDHIAGVDRLRAMTGAKFAAYKTMAGVDMRLNDGDAIQIGNVEIDVTFCPGHCHDTILLLCDNSKLIVSDELFIGGVGITRNAEQARLHYNNLHGILLKFPDAVEVYPGHDYGTERHSTIGEQKRTNPYLLQPDFESFWHLRQNWKTYCREHSIQWG